MVNIGRIGRVGRLGAVGGGGASIIEQILASSTLVEGWVPGVSPMYQTHTTDTPATAASALVDRMDGLSGASFKQYANGTTTRPVFDGVNKLTFDGSNDYMTSDTSATYTSGLLMGSVLATTRFVTVAALRALTVVNTEVYVGGGRNRAETIMWSGGPGTGLFAATSSFSHLTAHNTTTAPFVITSDFNGASSRKFINGALAATATTTLAGNVDGITIGSIRQGATITNFAHMELFGLFVFDDYDASTIALAEEYLASRFAA
jgi:hypothetical protein